MNERVYLRALEIEDYKLISKWRNDPKVTRYLCGNVFFVSSEREKKSIENKILDDSRNLYLGVCLIEDDNLIGYVQINNIDLRNQKAEWGGTLIGETEFLGKGYGEEASRLLLNFLFDQYPINKCYGYCLSEHPVTAALFEKLGFKKDGVLRQEVFKNGKFKDILLYSILRDEINIRF
jgi:RimJ/RimL family protein N-acetyltransferase